MNKSIMYFDEAGEKNTEETIKLARERAQELGINDIVVASSHGETALKVSEIFGDPTVNIVAVTISESFREKDWSMSSKERARVQTKGIKVLTSIHALGDNVSSNFTEKWGGITIEEVVRETLYRFSQGMKVCVEIVLMAADAGLIPMDKEVLAIAGTGGGADTAIVVKPSYPRKFLNFTIKEIIAKPREG